MTKIISVKLSVAKIPFPILPKKQSFKACKYDGPRLLLGGKATESHSLLQFCPAHPHFSPYRNSSCLVLLFYAFSYSQPVMWIPKADPAYKQYIAPCIVTQLYFMSMREAQYGFHHCKLHFYNGIACYNFFFFFFLQFHMSTVI